LSRRLARQPAAAALTLSKLVAVLTSSIWQQELAGVEPVGRRGSGENGRKLTGKLRIVGTTPMPESKPVRHVHEAKHFLDATVAIRRNDQSFAGQLTHRARDTNDYVVMKFALLPMVYQVVSTPALANPL
jgi:hypothetical protein